MKVLIHPLVSVSMLTITREQMSAGVSLTQTTLHFCYSKTLLDFLKKGHY